MSPPRVARVRYCFCLATTFHASRSDQVDINDDVTYTIRTVAVYKYPTEADDERPEELTFTTGGNGGVCGISLTIGTEYLLGLTFNLDGELTADSCDLFRHWDGLTDDELSLLETNCFDSSCDGNCEWGTQVEPVFLRMFVHVFAYVGRSLIHVRYLPK